MGPGTVSFVTSGLMEYSSEQSPDPYVRRESGPHPAVEVYELKATVALRHQSTLWSPPPICTRPELVCCVGWRFQRDGSADFERSRFRSEPMAIEPRTRCPTFNGPATRTFCARCNPLEITQPHWLQSGVPPNWHGAIGVLRSADSVLVVRANTHSSGDDGGSA